MPCLMGESKHAWGCAVVQLDEAASRRVACSISDGFIGICH